VFSNFFRRERKGKGRKIRANFLPKLSSQMWEEMERKEIKTN